VIVDEQRRRGIIYARVSFPKQRQAGKLDCKVEALQAACPSHDVSRDVGSGVNFKRRGLRTPLKRAFAGVVCEVVTPHKHRLSLFVAASSSTCLRRRTQNPWSTVRGATSQTTSSPSPPILWRAMMNAVPPPTDASAVPAQPPATKTHHTTLGALEAKTGEAETAATPGLG
jgi:hypothetical protein